MRRSARVLGTLVVTGLALAYIIWKVDVGQALRILGDANWWWFFLSATIMLVTVVPMAWRWQWLLDAHDIHDGAVWINGARLNEPYTTGVTEPGQPFLFRGPLAGKRGIFPYTVPADCFFVMGDNRGNSLDSRFTGCIPRANIVGTPVMIYMSIDEPSPSWESGSLIDRFFAYASAVLHPGEVRWRRLFRIF